MPTIRRAIATDVEQLSTMATAFATSFKVERPAFFRAFSHLYKQDDVLILVAADSAQSSSSVVIASPRSNPQSATNLNPSDHLIGYLLGFDRFAFFANGRISTVEEIYVDPTHRRNGVGKALMQSFENWARSRNSKLVSLSTSRAPPFYHAIRLRRLRHLPPQAITVAVCRTR